MYKLFYFAVTVFAVGWSVYLLHAAATGRAVFNRNVPMSQRTLIAQALTIAWVGIMSATAVFETLAPWLPLWIGLTVLVILTGAFMVSLAVDARRTPGP